MCPTSDSIVSGNVPMVFRVNHNEFKPTHTLCWVPDQRDYPYSHYVLRDRWEIEARTEVTFNYKFGKVTYKF